MKAFVPTFLLLLSAASAYGQTATPAAPVATPAPVASPDQPGAKPATAAATAPAAFPSSGYISYAFRDIGAPQGLRLLEGSAEGGLTYMVRRDEVITAARLRLMLENSAGFPADTKLDVTVNGNSVGTVDIGSASHGVTVVDLPVDPIYWAITTASVSSSSACRSPRAA